MTDTTNMLGGLPAVLLVTLESLISFITFLLPRWLIKDFTKLTRLIFSAVSSVPLYSKDPIYDAFIREMDVPQNEVEDDIEEVGGNEIIAQIRRLKNAKNIREMCAVFGYGIQDHLVVTKDGYCLTLHRIVPRTDTPRNGKVVYMQHGLLMCSEVWVTMYKERLNIPFVLCDAGYDVWLGNNRGNKYSCKHVSRRVTSEKFWAFSIDEYAMFDIPDSLEYILRCTKKTKVSYIGFSQGCTQGLAAVSINKQLRERIDRVVLISPATTPHGLSNWLINSIINMSPEIMFLLFGKRILLKSAYFWRNTIYPPLYIKVIDWANDILFNWKSDNINYMQKFVSYYHLYSTTSVKSVVHWFQIIKSKKFQMYDANKNSPDFQTFQFPIGGNHSNIMVLYGTTDSLVDVDLLAKQLHTIARTEAIDRHEHLDLIWGSQVDTLVIEPLCEFLK